ncbi:MAG: cytochrome c [Proteobacteria bacterium]|nr:cytochrome c [Pseudomonadota bacterium]
MKATILRPAVLGLTMLGLAVTGCATGLGGDREEAMETVGGAFKPIGAMAKSGAFDQAEVSEKAKLIATELEHFGSLFPEGSEKAGGAALSSIWSDRTGFDAARTNARDAAVQLASVSDPAAFPAAVGKLGDACGACHSKYRAEY